MFQVGESYGLEFNPSESELFRAIPKSVSEPIRKTYSISFKGNRLKINPAQSDSIRDFNPNESKSSFQSDIELIQIGNVVRIDSEWFGMIFLTVKLLMQFIKLVTSYIETVNLTIHFFPVSRHQITNPIRLIFKGTNPKLRF